MRADRLLVARGLAASRTLAQRMIAAGAVRAAWQGREFTVNRGSAELPAGADLSVSESAATRFVSRGGLKLEAALARTAIPVSGLIALDVGISTGGFADCLLRHGAARVVGIDVGHGQLAAALRADSRLVAFEGINARSLEAADLGAEMPPQGFALVVVDVSFISLAKVIPALSPLMAAQGEMLALVKPQFEVGPRGLGKGGIVTDPALIPGTRERIAAVCAAHALQCRDWFQSPIAGGDGNREYFVHARRTAGVGESAAAAVATRQP
ncbi:MAG: TlyA family RNA methyltransferase [Burkholderiales bacterium]|nr:MAG: TlyA family RNA methyltransferase [Burkholderiales bacterium]